MGAFARWVQREPARAYTIALSLLNFAVAAATWAGVNIPAEVVASANGVLIALTGQAVRTQVTPTRSVPVITEG